MFFEAPKARPELYERGEVLDDDDGGGYISDDAAPAWTFASSRLNPKERLELRPALEAATGVELPDAATAGVQRAMLPGSLPQTWSVPADAKNELFCASYSADGALLAVGGRDGRAHVLRADTGQKVYTLGKSDARGIDVAPCTALQFRPAPADTAAGPGAGTKNVLLCASADGSVRHVHVTSGQVLHTLEEADNQIFALACRPDGGAFATAGRDRTVRVYDEATCGLTAALSGGAGGHGAGAGNNLYAVRFHPGEPSGAVLLSGGWDNTIQVWDVRAGGAVRSLYGGSGAYVCGDALDAQGGEVLAGSWRTDEAAALQIFDYGSGAVLARVLDSDPLYAAAYGRGPHHAGLLLVGGSGRNEARVVVRATGKALGRVRGGASAVHALVASPTEPRVAVITATEVVCCNTQGMAAKAA